MTDEFLQKVEQINERLRSYGKEAVQKVAMYKRDSNGKVQYENGEPITIGRVLYGYRPQYVFDAVNEILGAGNWRYEILSKEIFSKQAVAEVKLFIRINDEWLCKGSQTGQSNIVKENVGDAYKGAVTDAIQKCFSLLSIGQDSYRGLLKSVYLGNTKGTRPPLNTKQPPRPPKPPVKTTKPKPSTPPEPINHPLPKDLPPIAGVDWVWNDDGDRIIAVGDTYNKKQLIRSSGFKFNGTEKHWYKEYPPVVQ